MKIVYVLALLFIMACSSEIERDTYLKIQRSGNDISNEVQGTLLANVGNAMQKGGPEYAVEFCNLNAGLLIDSLNQLNNCTISRVSEKNRNPKSGLSAEEKKLWQEFSSKSLTDTVIHKNNKLVFYKSIKIAMPACLKCHGNSETDINLATRQKLEKLYPKDLATGYSLNDFRGLWKIEFENE